MQMKHFLSAAVLSAAMPLTAFAGEDKSEEVINALNLDGDRAEQVQGIMEDYHDQKKEIKKLAHEQVKQLKDLKKQRLEAVLSDNEMQQLESMMEEKKEKRKEKYKEHKDKWNDDSE